MLTRLPRTIPLALLLAAVSAQAADGVPAVRVTAPNGRTSVLLGSMHLGHPALRQPAPSLLHSARALVIEHHTDSEISEKDIAPEVIASQVVSGWSVQASWSRRLTEAQKTTLYERAKCHTMRPIRRSDFEMLFVQRSPRLMSGLAFYPCIPLPSRDTLVMRAADAQGIPIVPLESAAAIARQRNAIPDRLYTELLYLGLARDLVADYGQLADMLNRGDYAAVLAEAATMFTAPADNVLYQRTMLNERNHAWLAPLRVQLDVGDAVVLVGAAHLPGPDGLLALLSAAGYQLAPITVPAAP